MARDNLTENLDKNIFDKDGDSGLDISFVSTTSLTSDNTSDAINEIQAEFDGAVITQPISVVRNTDITTDLNTASFTAIPIFGDQDRVDAPITVSGQSYVVGAYTGPAIVNAMVHCSSAAVRPNMQVAVAVNGIVVTAKSACGYIRGSSGHEEGSYHLMDIIEVSPGDIITLVSRQEAAAGSVTMKENRTSNFIIRIPLQNAAKGEPGVDGYSGFDYIFVAGTPGPGDGVSGDIGQNTLNGAIYKKNLGTWEYKANITGPTGPAGADGYSGFDYIFSNGIPLNIDGNDGDINTNSLTGDVYKKESGVWNWKANIKGDQGIPGPSGFSYIFASESGLLSDNSYEWHFGDGGSNSNQYKMVLAKDTRILGMSLGLQDASNSGSVNVECRVNGSSIGSVTLPQGDESGFNIFSTPVDVSAGDYLNFRTVLSGNGSGYGIVALLITHI